MYVPYYPYYPCIIPFFDLPSLFHTSILFSIFVFTLVTVFFFFVPFGKRISQHNSDHNIIMAIANHESWRWQALIAYDGNTVALWVL